MLMFVLLPKTFVFEWYTTGLFPLIRSVIDSVSQLIPIPFLYFLIGLLLFLFSRFCLTVIRTKASFKLKAKLVLASTLNNLLAIMILFYWLWGFNYASKSFFNYNGLEMHPVSIDWVEEEYFRVLDTLNTLSTEVKEENWEGLETDVLDELLTSFLDIYYVNASLDPVVKEIAPMGFLLRCGAQGIYLPWTGQGQIDAGLHDLQKPFTYLHEMSHCYGLTNEGECNFIAFQVAIRCTDPYVRYSAYLSYWRYLARQMLLIGCHDKDLMNSALQSDLLAIYENYDKYPDFFPRFRVKSYDLYLKVQGVEEGLKSYSEIIMMNYIWSQR